MLIDAIEDCNNLTDKHTAWEYIKCRIRTKSIEYSIQKTKETREMENLLYLILLMLEEDMGNHPQMNKLEEYNLIKSELEFIHNERAKGTIVRSRCQWIR